jgi:hypothetical protein
MTTRPSRNAPKTAEAIVPAQSTFAIPAAWGEADVEIFAGHDLTDKKELVGVPFLITGIEIERNDERGYDIAYVYAMDANGTEFEFADTSTTGVKTQLQAYLVEKGLNPAPGGGVQPVRLALVKGLRVSEFKVDDEQTGKKRDASVYYLTAGARKTR